MSRSIRVRRAAALWTACVLCACHRDPPPAPHRGHRPTQSSPATPAHAAAPAAESADGTIDLLPMLQNGSIDANGPLIDLGELEAVPFVLPPLPTSGEAINGQSWATSGPRLRLRVPIDVSSPPDLLRLRVRRARVRRIIVAVDGFIASRAELPNSEVAAVVAVPLVPGRFRRANAEIELRFVGAPRAAPGTVARTETPRAVPAAVAAATRTPAVPAAARSARVRSLDRPVIDIDWIHFTRSPTASTRVREIVDDVRLDGPPRRALTLFAPTSTSFVTVIPAAATLRVSLAAEAVRGGRLAQRPVQFRLSVEADGVPTLEQTADVVPSAHWRDVSYDLSAFAGKAARVRVSAVGDASSRLAVAEPRFVRPVPGPSSRPADVRRVLLLVLRGARMDRFSPTLSARLSGGGFARLGRESMVASAVIASPNAIPALASVITGLPADVHAMADVTDTLDEQIETPAATLQQAGVATAAFSDDAWFWGSGLDRGFLERRGCTNDQATCRIETLMPHLADWLARQRERRAFAMVVTRAGVVPLDPADELLTAVDPNPGENALRPDQTVGLQSRSRHGPVALEPRELARLASLYDASMLAVDRSLSQLLDRLRDRGLLADTAVIVVGDRGTVLGELGRVGDGPVSLSLFSHTLLMLRIPSTRAQFVPATHSTLDAVATVLDLLNVRHSVEDLATRAGASSLVAAPSLSLPAGGIVTVASVRGDRGLRFGELFALPRPSRTYVLIEPDRDPEGATDLAPQRPIALAFAQSVLARYAVRDDAPNPRPTYASSTRALPAAVEVSMRASGELR